jgi:hypothetical protein
VIAPTPVATRPGIIIAGEQGREKKLILLSHLLTYKYEFALSDIIR